VNTTHNVIAAVLLGVALAAGCANMEDKSLGQNLSDSEITAKVKARFVADDTVSALDIKVDTYKGTVQLSGFAKNVDEVTRASDIARRTEGVKLVKNDIQLQ
jgi:hyperosmotically inducible protein